MVYLVKFKQPLIMCDQKEVSKYNLLTASYLDENLSTLEGCETYGSNPLAGMGAVNYDATIMPRGVIVPTKIVIVQNNGTTGAFVNNSPVCETDGNIFRISISVRLTEPLLFLSPFAELTKSQDDAFLLGINNMNIICNIRSNLGGY